MTDRQLVALCSCNFVRPIGGTSILSLTMQFRSCFLFASCWCSPSSWAPGNESRGKQSVPQHHGCIHTKRTNAQAPTCIHLITYQHNACLSIVRRERNKNLPGVSLCCTTFRKSLKACKQLAFSPRCVAQLFRRLMAGDPVVHHEVAEAFLAQCLTR